MAYQLLQMLIASRATTTAVKAAQRRGVLFISYSFSNSDLYDRVERLAKRQFEVVSGKKLKGTTTREGIITLMEMCTHFLGIWTEEGGTPVQNGYSPSPWLHWEWGVADALGLTWHLLISNKIDEQAWNRIAGDTPHSIFSISNFDEQLKDALKSL